MADSPSPTCFSETITLTHRATKTHIHKELSVLRQWCSPTQDLPHTSTEKISHLGEDESEERKIYRLQKDLTKCISYNQTPNKLTFVTLLNSL